MSYVTVMPASNNRRGWMVASRVGHCIEHRRLDAPSASAKAARAEAEALFPDRIVYMAGDAWKPWEHYDIGVAEHGARRGTLFARCACGWVGPARRSLERSAADLNEHLNPKGS